MAPASAGNLAMAHPEALRAFVSVVGGPYDRSMPRTRGIGVGGPAPPPMFEVPTSDPDRLRRPAERARVLQGRWEHLSAEERAIAPGKVFPELETNEELAQRLSEVRVPHSCCTARRTLSSPPGWPCWSLGRYQAQS